MDLEQATVYFSYLNRKIIRDLGIWGGVSILLELLCATVLIDSPLYYFGFGFSMLPGLYMAVILVAKVFPFLRTPEYAGARAQFLADPKPWVQKYKQVRSEPRFAVSTKLKIVALVVATALCFFLYQAMAGA